MRHLAIVISLVGVATVGCGPNIKSLLRHRHYNEAICAGVEASRAGRRQVVQTLIARSGVQLHVEEVTRSELQRALGKAADGVHKRVHFIRIRAQTNVLPVDNLELDTAVYDGGGRIGAAPVSWRSLAWVTGERLPGPRRRQTYRHAGNVLRGLFHSVTIGIPYFVMALMGRSLLPFTKATYLAKPTRSEYVRSAPLAAGLQRLMHRRGCQRLGLPVAQRKTPGRGVKCVWYHVAVRHPAAHWRLKVYYRFTARRFGRSLQKDRSCVLSDSRSIALGRSPELSRRLSERFGARYRPMPLGRGSSSRHTAR